MVFESQNRVGGRLGSSCGGTDGSRVVESSDETALCWTTVTTTVVQVMDSRVLGEADRQQKCIIQMEIRGESVRCGRRPAAVSCSLS